MYSCVIGTVVFACAGLAYAQIIPQKVYLLPKGLEGEVYIFHGVKRGEDIERAGNTTTFRIPGSRFLITSYVADDSPYQATFYYVGRGGEKTLLEVEYSSLHKTKENLASKRPFIWNPGRSVSSWWDKILCEVRYEQFYVGTRPKMFAKTQKDLDKEYFRFQAFVEANVDKICEGKPRPQYMTIQKPAS